MSKKTLSILIIIAIVIGLPVAWYLLSPLWRTMVVNDPSPIISVSDTTAPDSVPPLPVSVHHTPEPTPAPAPAPIPLPPEKESPAPTPQVPPTAPPAPTPPPPAPVPTPAPQARVISQGNFVPQAHSVAGQVLLIDNQGKKILRFENFESTNGPDVRVYLSTGYDIRDAVELSSLKATSGNVNYDVPAGVDTATYNKVLIWCRPFRVLFSSADLK